MQYFKKDMKQILFLVLKFQIAQGATFWDTQLAPSKFNPRGASGQLLISNTAWQVYKTHIQWSVILPAKYTLAGSGVNSSLVFGQHLRAR